MLKAACLTVIICCCMGSLFMIMKEDHALRTPKPVSTTSIPNYASAVTHLKQAAESRGLEWRIHDSGIEDEGEFCAAAFPVGDPFKIYFTECESNPSTAAEKTAEDIENNKPFSRGGKDLAHGEPEKQSTSGDCSPAISGGSGDVTISCN